MKSRLSFLRIVDDYLSHLELGREEDDTKFSLRQSQY